ncbi:hypothetical protein V8C44DRAFT_314715 [Trichoderma aethiopicum]
MSSCIIITLIAKTGQVVYLQPLPLKRNKTKHTLTFTQIQNLHKTCGLAKPMRTQLEAYPLLCHSLRTKRVIDPIYRTDQSSC